MYYAHFHTRADPVEQIEIPMRPVGERKKGETVSKTVKIII